MHKYITRAETKEHNLALYQQLPKAHKLPAHQLGKMYVTSYFRSQQQMEK